MLVDGQMVPCRQTARRLDDLLYRQAPPLSYLGGTITWVKQHLQQAVAAFDLIRSGQQLAAHGNWQDWYRGDKKMNLRKVEAQTREVSDLLVDKK